MVAIEGLIEMVNMDPSKALRCIPSLDAFLRRSKLAALSRPLVQRESRLYLESLRAKVLAGELDESQVQALFAGDAGEQEVLRRCALAQSRHHRRVFNATGIVLHTGIGRAPMAPAAQQAMADAGGYAIVEVDPKTGLRNQREVAVAALLREVTGAGGALVVNNNAAATTLVLAATATGREVLVSRGELVEIGGGFRMPDVMAQAGCNMVEVGTTNRTHLRDYQTGMTADTAMLLKVHTSNFLIQGFTSVPSLQELTDLARKHGLLAGEDLGSGLLLPQPLPGMVDEPRVMDSLATGADLVWFSGDKLLGGPQCGIILGDRDLVAKVRAHPLYRAFRCDKTSLAALEATLRIYRDGDPLQEIPVLRALSCPVAELQERAEELLGLLKGVALRCVATESFAGSGANPARSLPSYAVALPGGEATALALRSEPGMPIISRIDKGEVLLDLRSLCGEDLSTLADLVRTKLQAKIEQASS